MHTKFLIADVKLDYKLSYSRERITMRVNLSNKPEKDTIEKFDEGLSLGEERSIFTDVPSNSHHTPHYKVILYLFKF